MRIDSNMPENKVVLQTLEKVEGQSRGKAKEHGVMIRASELNLMRDSSILERKKKAMQEAMGIVSKQFEADDKIDMDLERRSRRIVDNKEIVDCALKEKQVLNQEQENLKEFYGIEADSQEQQDLELQLKIRNAMKSHSRLELTEEARMKFYKRTGSYFSRKWMRWLLVFRIFIA